LERCLDLGVPKSKLHRSPDLAFTFALKTKLPVTPRLANILIRMGAEQPIGVSVREHVFPASANPRRAQADYIKTVARALRDFQQAHGARIVIIPQTLEDLPTGARLAHELSALDCPCINLIDDFTTDELAAIYDRLGLLVGTRMHANILAMCTGTPVVAISYDPKTDGILASMGLEEWVVAIEAIDDGRLLSLMERQWRDRCQLGDLARSRALAQAQKTIADPSATSDEIGS
jgi:colanic acid/amylovoran biosynthesis protein